MNGGTQSLHQQNPIWTLRSQPLAPITHKTDVMPRPGSQGSASFSLDLFFLEHLSATPLRSLHRELSDASSSGPRLLSLLPSDALTASPISHRALQGPTPGLGNTATDVAPALERGFRFRLGFNNFREKGLARKTQK